MTARVLTTPAADAQIRAADAWWRSNRPAAPSLFADELAEAFRLLAQAPRLGPPHRRRGIPGLRRLLVAATRYHVYYLHNAASDALYVLAVWSAVRGRGPPLAPP